MENEFSLFMQKLQCALIIDEMLNQSFNKYLSLAETINVQDGACLGAAINFLDVFEGASKEQQLEALHNAKDSLRDLIIAAYLMGHGDITGKDIFESLRNSAGKTQQNSSDDASAFKDFLDELRDN
jgi:hypothetical protein